MSGDEEDSNAVTPGVPAEEGGQDEQPNAPGEREALATLASLEGWRVDGEAARVHYASGGDRYSIEFYSREKYTLYWMVPSEEDAAATPVPRGRVPNPLRERIQEDLSAAGIDPAVDERSL